MPRLHLITAHRSIDRSDEPVVLYCGHDADKALATRDRVLATGEFALADKWIPESRNTRYASAAQRAVQQTRSAPPAEAREKPRSSRRR